MPGNLREAGRIFKLLGQPRLQGDEPSRRLRGGFQIPDEALELGSQTRAALASIFRVAEAAAEGPLRGVVIKAFLAYMPLVML